MALFKKKKKNIIEEEKIPAGIEIEGDDEEMSDDEYEDNDVPADGSKEDTPAPAVQEEVPAPEIKEDATPQSEEKPDVAEDTPEEVADIEPVEEDDSKEGVVEEDVDADVPTDEDVPADISEEDDDDKPVKPKKRKGKKVLIIAIAAVIICLLGGTAYYLYTMPEEEPAVFISYDLSDWKESGMVTENTAIKYLLYGEHSVTNPNATQVRDLTFRFYPSGKYSGHSQTRASIVGTWDIDVLNGVRCLVITSNSGVTESYVLELDPQTELITLTDSTGVYVIHYLDSKPITEN